MLDHKTGSPTVQALLVCRLRPKQLRRGNSPTAGEIEIENASADVLEIEIDRHPLQYLNLVVTDQSGSILSEGHYGDTFSPRGRIDTLRLTPGATYHHIVSLLGTVPEAKRLPGMYSVQAVYDYNGFRAISELLVVELEGEST